MKKYEKVLQYFNNCLWIDVIVTVLLASHQGACRYRFGVWFSALTAKEAKTKDVLHNLTERVQLEVGISDTAHLSVQF